IPIVIWLIFFFQAEDGIRAGHVTGVQTCALPISFPSNGRWFDGNVFREKTVYVINGLISFHSARHFDRVIDLSGGFVVPPFGERSEERRVGKECRARGVPELYKRKLDNRTLPK